ncbi:unnamed protein product, partial [Allacma fusca]
MYNKRKPSGGARGRGGSSNTGTGRTNWSGGSSRSGSKSGGQASQENGSGGSAYKKAKFSQEDEDMEMDEMEAAFVEEMEEEVDTVVGEEDDTVTTATYAEWDRPDAPPLDCKKKSLTFQQFDVDSYISNEVWPGMPGSKIPPVPVIRMYGVTDDGNAVCCHVHGFSPYFYVSV